MFKQRKKQHDQPDHQSCDNQLDTQYIQGLSNLWAPATEIKTNKRDIADVLLEMNKITNEQFEQIRRLQKQQPGHGAVEATRQLGFVGKNDMVMAGAELYGYEYCQIKAEDVQEEAFDKLGIDYVRKNKVVPLEIKGQTLIVAICKPADVFVIDDVKRYTGMNVMIVMCSEDDIAAVCDRFGETKWTDCVEDLIQDITENEITVIQKKEQEPENLEKIAGESPIIKFVNYIISNAAYQGASDIHIEPRDKISKVRYRIDGTLFELMTIPMPMHPAVVSRLKIMSNLDISQRRLPQDGRITAIVGEREIDLRISTLPTSFGEKVVIRLLDGRSVLRGLEELGMESNIQSAFSKQIQRPHGIILVTGPTGSGKTTTLYSALSQMDGVKLNISTVEDPVEYQLDFCNQTHVNEKIGLTFASALRSLLRQDPDVIMIGEIRDAETAGIATQAALTGHLVLSTLHTNDASSSVTRLVDIGVEPYLIAASLNAVLAQRLVRKICPHCKQRYEIPQNMHDVAEQAGLFECEIFHGVGCEHCRESGYLGRLGIYELLEVDDNFRDTITSDPSINNMRRTFAASGKACLYDDGIRTVKLGLTTLEEVLRVSENYNLKANETFLKDGNYEENESLPQTINC